MKWGSLYETARNIRQYQPSHQRTTTTEHWALTSRRVNRGFLSHPHRPLIERSLVRILRFEECYANRVFKSNSEVGIVEV